MDSSCTPAQVEVTATDDDLQRMIAHVERTFQAYGVQEPYWSVLTAERFLKQNLSGSWDEFFRSGQENVESALADVARCIDRPIPTGTCCELGCGVGRATMFLAERFHHVIATDISLPHLEILRQNARSFGRTNIAPCHVSTLAALDGLPEFDFFFTQIVLQHNPPPVMAMLLRKLLSKLRPGGVAHFQVPTYLRGYRFSVADYLAHPPEGIEMHCLPQRHLFRIFEQTGCKVMEIREDGWIGQDIEAYTSNTITVRRID